MPFQMLFGVAAVDLLPPSLLLCCCVLRAGYWAGKGLH
jgi:hypothetical protein